MIRLFHQDLIDGDAIAISFSPSNAQAKLRAEGRAFSPRGRCLTPPRHCKKREPKEPSASACC
jgi:hypothetical protein